MKVGMLFSNFFRCPIWAPGNLEDIRWLSSLWCLPQPLNFLPPKSILAPQLAWQPPFRCWPWKVSSANDEEDSTKKTLTAASLRFIPVHFLAANYREKDDTMYSEWKMTNLGQFKWQFSSYTKTIKLTATSKDSLQWLRKGQQKEQPPYSDGLLPWVPSRS